MRKRAKQEKTNNMFTVPKSILFKSLKGAIESGEEESISDLTDILYASMQYHAAHESQISENSLKIDGQRKDVVNAIESMKEGFRQVDKRIDQMDKRIDQMDKRIDQMDKHIELVDKNVQQQGKRLDDLIHQTDKRFDGLIHQMDKRFEQVDKRFTFQAWLVGIGFVTINTLVVLIKIFG